MRVIAIDPGFERMGVAVLEKKNGQEVVLFSSCLRTSARLPFPERLMSLAEDLDRIFAKWSPEALAIETLSFNTNKKTAMRVAEAKGVAVYTAAKNGSAVEEFSPSQIKAACTGYGKAAKADVEKMVRAIVDTKGKKMLDDELDAIAIGIAFLATVRGAEKC